MTDSVSNHNTLTEYMGGPASHGHVTVESNFPTSVAVASTTGAVTSSAPLSMSQTIKARLQFEGHEFKASDNISAFIKPGELEVLQRELESKMQEVLETLVIDTVNDHNTRGTAARIAKMYLNEVFHGRYKPRPKATEFPNIHAQDELYLVGPITIRSACAHHLVPIEGKVWIGVFPSENVLGLSKFHRLTEWIMSRPVTQEEATNELANELNRIMKPKGLAVICKARHLCASWRGVKDADSFMVTSSMTGSMRNNPEVKKEFLSLVNLSEHM